MGLVVQAPIDAPLPVSDPAAATQGQTQGESGTGDVFAGLLASLSAGLDAEPKGVKAESLEIPIGELAPETDEKKQQSNPFAALMAMTMPLPLSTPTMPSTELDGSSAVEAVAGTEGVESTVGQELAPDEAGAAVELPLTDGLAPAAATESIPMADVLPDVVAAPEPSDSIPVESSPKPQRPR